jgi:hypothetical protein
VNRTINVGTWKCKLMVENVETIPGMILVLGSVVYMLQ